MKVSRVVFFSFSFFFLSFFLKCSNAFDDEKIDLQIELVNPDALLSDKHLQKIKKIVHGEKIINIKFFQKVHKNILEKAFIITEEDNADDSNVIPLKQLTDIDGKTNVDDNTYDKGNSADLIHSEIKTNEKDKIKVISSEESKENDMHMLRKVYQKTEGNKETVYCYMKYTFHVDLDNMGENIRNELFKSLDTMPDYLSFLYQGESSSISEKILEKEYKRINDEHDKSQVGKFSALEFSNQIHNNIKFDIADYILNLDEIIDYLIIAAEEKKELHGLIRKLIDERKHLYILEEHNKENNNDENNEFWNNKDEVEKFYLYKALSNIKSSYFHWKNFDNRNIDENSKYHDKIFFNLIEKALYCSKLLSETNIMDSIILEKMNKASEANEIDRSDSDTDKLSLNKNSSSSENTEQDIYTVKKCREFLKIAVYRDEYKSLYDTKSFQKVLEKLKNYENKEASDTYTKSVDEDALDDEIFKLKNEIDNSSVFLHDDKNNVDNYKKQIYPHYKGTENSVQGANNDLSNSKHNGAFAELQEMKIASDFWSDKDVNSIFDLGYDDEEEEEEEDAYEDEDEDEDEDEEEEEEEKDVNDDDEEEEEEEEEEEDVYDDEEEEQEEEEEDDLYDDEEEEEEEDDAYDGDDEEENDVYNGDDEEEDDNISIKDIFKNEAKKLKKESFRAVKQLGKTVLGEAMGMGKKLLNSAVKKGKSKIGELLNTGTSKLDNFINKGTSKIDNFLNKGTSALDNALVKRNEKANSVMKKGKKVVSGISKKTGIDLKPKNSNMKTSSKRIDKTKRNGNSNNINNNNKKKISSVKQTKKTTTNNKKPNVSKRATVSKNDKNNKTKSVQDKSKKVSSLRKGKGNTKNMALISLSEENSKIPRNKKDIKKEINKISKTYKKLAQKKEVLKNMMHKPFLSDAEIIEQFENYMKSSKKAA